MCITKKYRSHYTIYFEVQSRLCGMPTIASFATKQLLEDYVATTTRDTFPPRIIILEADEQVFCECLDLSPKFE